MTSVIHRREALLASLLGGSYFEPARARDRVAGLVPRATRAARPPKTWHARSLPKTSCSI